MLRLSARVPPWSTLHHVGRRSGREYRTPVMSFAAREPAGTGGPVTVATEREVLVVHPLPWGADVDWWRNVRAAGEYTLTRQGTDYRVDRVRVVDADTADDLLGPVVGALSRFLGVREFVVGRLRRVP
jgi:deazaflavin-dependent oxidoreductase (nitroreductase family)